MIRSIQEIRELVKRAPVGATHYLPECSQVFECWVKEGYSMRVDSQHKWVSDPITNNDIGNKLAIPLEYFKSKA